MVVVFDRVVAVGGGALFGGWCIMDHSEVVIIAVVADVMVVRFGSE